MDAVDAALAEAAAAPAPDGPPSADTPALASADAPALASVDAPPPACPDGPDAPPRMRLLLYRQYPFPDPLRQDLRAINPDTPLAELMRMDSLLGEAFAGAALALLDEAGLQAGDIEVIGSHGQTVCHLPDGPQRNSWQLGDPNIIVWRTGIPAAADFRRMDLAAGGQGAPLAPAFHAWHWRKPGCPRVIANIGGISNITILPGAEDAPVRGLDTGPGNCLMDDWHARHRGSPMDRDGAWARQGRVNAGLLEQLLRDPWFQRPAPKSTGREYFNVDWLQAQLAGHAVSAEDVQATLLELTARTLCREIQERGAGQAALYVCGGGARNPLLMERLAALLPQAAAADTAALGVDPDAVEALTFAWLACCRLRGAPVSLGGITGGRRATLGALYAPPGRKA